jgi:hypothetical protein
MLHLKPAIQSAMVAALLQCCFGLSLGEHGYCTHHVVVHTVHSAPYTLLTATAVELAVGEQIYARKLTVEEFLQHKERLAGERWCVGGCEAIIMIRRDTWYSCAADALIACLVVYSESDDGCATLAGVDCSVNPFDVFEINMAPFSAGEWT